MLDKQVNSQPGLLERFDLRVKILIIVLLSLIAVVVHKLTVLNQLLIFSCLLLLISGLGLKKIISRLVVINTFVLFLWLIMPLSYEGEVLFTLGRIDFYKEGFLYALRVTCRTNAIMILILTLLSPGKITDVIRALQQLHVPDRLIELLFLVVRYLPVLKEEYHKLFAAMKLRGFKSQTSWRSYKGYAYLMGILIVKSYERSQRIYQAMLCRGFRGQLHFKNEFKVSTLDIGLLLVMILFSGWLLGLEKGLIG